MERFVAIVLLCTVVGVNCLTAPYISFLGETLPNHAYVDLNLVGYSDSGRDSVQCHTNLSSCCGHNPGADGYGSGEWFAPTDNASTSMLTDKESDMYVAYIDQRIDLRQRENTGKSGIYRCEIDIAAADVTSGTMSREAVYVGLYASGGALKMADNMTVTLDSYNGRPQFTFTCKTTGGPATHIMWIRNRATARGLKQSVLTNPVTADYTHTLTVSGIPSGRYMCIITNNKPSRAEDIFNVEDDLLDVMPVSTSSTAVEISWSLARNVRATSYTISYSNSNTDCFKDSNTITGIPGSATMYTLTGLQEGTEYSITVTAKMSNGVTFEHRILANTLPTGPSAPPKYLNVTQVTNSSITIRWEAVDCIDRNGEITGYALRMGEMGSGTMQSWNVSENEATVSGLNPMTTYVIKVAAMNIFNIGMYSSATVQTLETVALNTDSLSVSVNSASNTSISLSLTLNEKLATVTNYSISYFNTNSTQCFTDSNDITGIAGSETVYTLTGLEEGTEYSVTVSATFSSGESLRKVVVCTTTEIAPSECPSAANVSEVTSSSLTFQWKPVECIHRNGQIMGYVVRYGVMGSESTQTVNVSQDVNQTTITGLQPDTLYSVQVAAVNSVSEGPYSASIEVSTYMDTLATPTVTEGKSAGSDSYFEAIAMSGSFGFLIGVIVTLLATICVFAVLNRCKSNTKSDLKDYIPGKEDVKFTDNEAYSSSLSIQINYQKEEAIYEHIE